MAEKRVAVFTGSRSEYGLLSPVIRAIAGDSSLRTYVIISGAHLSSDYGYSVNEIDVTGIDKIFRIPLETELHDEKMQTVASFSRLIEKSSIVLDETKPDMIVIAGDRSEAFAIAVTAFYLNIPIAHIFGGDVSQGGHLDDSSRHSITKLSHIHFTTNEDSYKRVLRLGEEPWRVFNVGSPVVDNVIAGNFAKREEVATELNLDLNRPIIIFTQHPLTTESGLSYDQAKQSMEALKEINEQTVITYPCNDAGSMGIIKAIHEYESNPKFRIRKNLGWKLYLGCLKVSSCVVGNSSSGLMETPAFGIPCVNIGNRQAGRLRSENVIDVPCEKEAIIKAIKKALKDREFIDKAMHCKNPYGSGFAAQNILKVIKEIPIDKKLLQKRMSY